MDRAPERYGLATLLAMVVSAMVVWPRGSIGALTPAMAVAAVLLALPLCYWMLAGRANWFAAFVFAALLLPPLPFSLGGREPHLSLLAAAMGMAVGGLRAHEWQRRWNAVSRRLLIFAAILASSVAWALLDSGWEIAAASFARVCLFGIAAYVYFFFSSGPAAENHSAYRALRWVFAAAMASAAFACADFYLQLPPPSGYARQFIWLESGVYRRAQGVFYEASTLGNLCAFMLLMIATVFTRPRKQRPLGAWTLAAGGLVIGGALMLSFSRSSVANVAAGLCALAYLHRGRLRLGRLAAAAGLTGGAAVLAALALAPAVSQLYWTRMLNSFRYFLESPNGILSGRVETWNYLLQFLLAHPQYAVLGVGYKTLPYSTFVGRVVIGDNAYLSLLVETGLVGLGAMLALSAAILRECRRAAASADPQVSFFGVWMFCFWCGEMVQMLSGDILTYWRVLPLYFWALAAARER